uniref:Uncharacterized protein n=1 Tax=Tanacetum cinerariifolium TaxID=118510 RepID=A0A6L2LUA0_TANCI|nr:hypothetical protein [Tanacetum cinerariifolium]
MFLVEQVPVVAPPTRTDDQILPSSKWVPIGKSNCVLDVQKSQRIPIFLIVVAILKNTNFFRAFTACSTILAIYIQQFWDTMCFNSSTGLYSCHLDEQWFNLHKDILRDALDITPTNDTNPYVAPPSSDTVIEYVNTLGYPSTLRNMSAMSVNALYQPWRAILSMINMCLTGAPYYDEYQEHVAKYQQYLDVEHGKAEEGGATESPKATKATRPKATKATKPAGDKAPKLTSTQPPKPKPAPTQPSKSVLEKKQKLVKDTLDEPSPAKRSKGGLVGKIRKPKSPLKLVDEPSAEDVPGLARLVVIREPESRRIPPLLDVQGKGKEKVVDEQAAHNLLTLHNLKYKSFIDQYILKRRTSMPIEASGHINARDQDEGQAGPNPGDHDKGQARSNPSDAAESKPQSSHVVHARPNLKHIDLEATDASTRQNPEQMDEEFTKTAYPNVQEKLKQPSEDPVILEEPASSTKPYLLYKTLKKNSASQISSSHLLGSSNDHSVIDLMTSQFRSPLPTSTTTTLIITTTSFPPPPQQSTVDPILVKRIVDEIVIDAVNWAMQAPLRARFSDLPAVDIKEILQQRMFKDKSYEAHEDHKNLYDALQKSLERDYSNQLLSDLEEARQKKRNRRALGSSQFPPPPPHPSTSTSGSAQQQGSKTLNVENNWATALVLAYKTPAENSLLAKTRDMTNFLNCKGSSPALSISKMKAASYPDFGLELRKFYIDIHNSLSRQKEVRSYMRILSVFRIKAYSRYEYDYLSKIVLRRADLQEHTIAEKDFKNLYPSDFEDLNMLLLQDFQLSIESYQTQLNLTKPGWNATGYEFKHDYTIIESPRAVVFPVNNNERKIMRFNEIYKFNDDMLTRILEALAYIVKEFKIKRLNPGMNTRFWTQKDVTRSKEFIAAIERQLKKKRIYRNLECFVGGRVRDIDYRLL